MFADGAVALGEYRCFLWISLRPGKMNFLMRSNTQHVAPESIPAIHEPPVNPRSWLKPPISTTLEGLISQDPFPFTEPSEDPYSESEGISDDNVAGTISKIDSQIVAESHSDVSDEEGWIVIPDGNLPNDWSSAPDIRSLRSLDREFVFPGEQVHILACLAAHKPDKEIITPFTVAAVMSKNGIGLKSDKQNGIDENEMNLSSAEGEVNSDSNIVSESTDDRSNMDGNQEQYISASESILKMENHKRQTEMLLQRFKNSHFFVRIAESGEPLWSKRFIQGDRSVLTGDETEKDSKKMSNFNALIDKGNIDANVFGGAARNSVNCCSLPNGDILVILQVNVGVDSLRDPTIEILQFEKHGQRNSFSDNNDKLDSTDYDPCGELLKWLFPLDNTLLPPFRSLSPPHVSSSSGILGASQRPASGSQLLSHFRSYSMSSLPQSTAIPPQSLKTKSSKPNCEDWDQYSSQKPLKNQKSGAESLLSFRGVALQRERFSVCCGLNGIHIPGKRWRRKIQIIQPVTIHSFAADCNTDDLLCVHIQNISPENARDVVVYVDAITIVFEEASQGGPPSSLPIACVEAGDEHSLPNLALRRGEEHSFILKPGSCIWKNAKVHRDKFSPSSSLRLPPHPIEGKKDDSNTDKYSVVVSCRSNYTESKLFFKQQTNWQPHRSRDLMISVTSDMTGDPSGPNGRVSQLPVQVSTLQASNLTSEDLTMTVLAPASFTHPPSMGSLSSTPTTPMSPFIALSESADRTAKQRSCIVHRTGDNAKQDGDEQASSAANVIPKSGLGCTHLCLQSQVPLGCVPAQSTATIKLELLPLTDGIITLDTLQIDVKEKGLTYVPEHSMQINATSSVSTGII